MWCHAAMASDKYSFLHEEFYRRARKYAELDEMKGYGESIVSTAHCQCLLLIGTYEFKRMFFPRAWLSVGKAARLALMMSFNRIDAPDRDGKQCSSPPRDFSEKEERRRVFWLSYCADRYASIGTGWPMIIDEKDVSDDPAVVCCLLLLTTANRSWSIFPLAKKHLCRTSRKVRRVSTTPCLGMGSRLCRP